MSLKANSLYRRTAGTVLRIGTILITIEMAVACQKTPHPPVDLAPTPPPIPSVTNAGTSVPETTSAKQGHPVFDGARAMACLQKQCDFGPRVLGTDAHEKCRNYLLSEMKKYADTVITQAFSYREMTVTNIIGVFYPAGSSSPSTHPVLLLAHWDSRPIADGPYSPENQKSPSFMFGPKGWNRTTPILGANDGASGVAVLLELARLFHEQKPPVGVLLLLDDGEDYGDFRANNNLGEGVELGTRYFAKHYRENKTIGLPDYGILLDMVGAKDAFFPREGNSQQYAPGTNEKVFQAAESLGYKEVFRSGETQEVEDDHVPIYRAGIPTIDIIQPLPVNNYATTGYTHWHTLKDTPDKCSPKTLKSVGETVAEVIYSELPRK